MTGTAASAGSYGGTGIKTDGRNQPDVGPARRLVMDLLTALNEKGATEANGSALKEQPIDQSIGLNGANGQAQSYRNLKRVINRQLKKDNMNIRRIRGRDQIVPLNSFYQVADLEALADRLGIIPCEVCHRRVANVYRYHDGVMCPRCITAAGGC